MATRRTRNPFKDKTRIFPLQIIIVAFTTCILLAYLVALYTVFSTPPATVAENGSLEPPVPPNAGQREQEKNSPAHQHSLEETKPKSPAGVTIGFAVTITGCGSDPITEGAAVLKHSVHLASVHGNTGGRYDYKMYAIYHPDGKSCALPLKDLGYEMIERETPVAVQDIKGDFLRQNIEKNGCCGEKELVKLEAYTLTQHPAVVHLDLDTLVLKPMDALFDWMLVDPNDLKSEYDTSDIPIMWSDMEKPSTVNAFFTRDCKFFILLGLASSVLLPYDNLSLFCLSRTDNMVGPTRKYKPVQGGLLILRPDKKVYDEFVAIIKEGDFSQKGGWGGKVGPFYGT